MGVNERPWMSHSVGAAQILKSRGHFGPQDGFESKLLLSLRGSVVTSHQSKPWSSAELASRLSKPYLLIKSVLHNKNGKTSF